MEEVDECPLAETHDKLVEADYFIHQMMNEYHDPLPFRFNLNAFLQALRSVTLVLQKEFSSRDGFREKWYPIQQDKMKADPLLRAFRDGRNIVVKQRSLEINSKAEIGVFRYWKLKGGIVTEVPVHVTSKHLLEDVAPKLGGVLPEHPFLGEQYGVRRTWYVPELGDGNVIDLCDLAWTKIREILSEAHSFAGWHVDPLDEHSHRSDQHEVLLETDLDPSLFEKWRWD